MFKFKVNYNLLFLLFFSIFNVNIIKPKESNNFASYKLAIIKIQNLSEGYVRLHSGRANKTLPYNIIDTGHTLIIPFVSINDYLKEFVSEDPYVPSRALKIETSLGTFGIWENELGVTCAPSYNAYHYKNIRSKCLAKGFNTRKPSSKIKKNIVKFVLIVDKSGALELKKSL